MDTLPELDKWRCSAAGIIPDAKQNALIGLRRAVECQRLAQRDHPAIPIIVLTALDAVDARVAGLDRGADDGRVKPFALDEGLAYVTLDNAKTLAAGRGRGHR